jgi:hypothetical protein
MTKRWTPMMLTLLLLLALLAAGCSGAVTGQVSSKTAKTPVAHATVKVGDQSVVTDTDGRYSVPKAKIGSQQVAVTAQGFGPYSGNLDVQRGDNTLNVVLEDGTVQILLKENAEVREPIKKTTMTIGGVAVKGGKGARIDASSVPVGESVVVVTSPGHLKAKQAITVKPGDNSVTIKLDLTPEETYMRYYAAYRFGRYRDSYSMIAPDVLKHYPYKKYVKDEKLPGTVVSLKLFGTKMLKSWRAKYLKKTYHEVAAVDRALRVEYPVYGTETDNRTQHWINIKGRWYIVFDWRDN